MALDKWRIESLPESAYYIRDFITEEEEERLLNKVGLMLLHEKAATPAPFIIHSTRTYSCRRSRE